jgi:hypothetical protein
MMNGSMMTVPNIRRIRRIRRGGLLVGLIGVTVACGAPRARPLTGVTPVDATLPHLELPPGYQKVTFGWSVDESSMVIRGDGVARIAPPDSARVDLVLGGGFGGMSAILIGNEATFPPHATMTDLMPPPPLLWAAFGRLALPALPDTVIRVSGDTLRADIGQPAQWRVTVVRDTLTALERLDTGRIVESVVRESKTLVRYESAADHRTLVLTIKKIEPANTFDASLWTY